MPNTEQKITILEDDIIFKGNMKLTSDLMLNGKIEGNITAENSRITVSKTGEIKGKVETKYLENFGKVYGEVKAEDYIVHSEAENDASVTVKKIMVEYGSFFNGNCRMERKWTILQ